MGKELDLPFFPRVALSADYRPRLERATALLGAEFARREGGGRSTLAGFGFEFTGHRPYRAGDDPRAIDWSLTARLDRPYVRVFRRDARERWRVAVDTSASMGVGPPGKLQRAAEVAGALVVLGLRRGAEVELVARGHRPLCVHKRTPGVLERLCAELGAWSTDDAGVAGSALDFGGPPRALGRLFWIGDPFAFEPSTFFAASERVPARHVLHLAAPHELAAPDVESVDWRDPESERALALALDRDARAGYARELERRLALWSDAARARGVRHAVRSSALPFEALLRAVVGA